jgi:hypothetical protein
VDSIPATSRYTISSREILQNEPIDKIASLLKLAPKLFPSVRRAVFERLSKTSVSGFVVNATAPGVTDVMLKFLPPKIFKRHLQEVRSLQPDMVNTFARFPPVLVKHLKSGKYEFQ